MLLFYTAAQKYFLSFICLIIIQIFLIYYSSQAQYLPFKNISNTNYDLQFLGLENEGVTVIAVDPIYPDIIYVGSGSDFSAGTTGGIFKSTNGGSTWDTLIRGVTVRDIDIHPTNSQIIYAALGINVLTQPGIIKSTNGGINWINADEGIQMSWELGPLALAIDPKFPDTLYVGTGGIYGGYPYKSTNGGENWFRIDPDSLWVWMYTPSGDSVFVNGYPLQSSIAAIGIDPINTNIVFVGTAGNGYVFKSKDGGGHWSYTGLQAGITTTIEFAKNTSVIYIGSSWSDSFPVGIFNSTDNGLTWFNIIAGLPDSLNVEKIQLCKECAKELVFLAGNWADNGGIWKYYKSWNFIWTNETRVNTITIGHTKLFAGSRGVWSSDIITSVHESNSLLQTKTLLYDNFPNPFNPQTRIQYEITEYNNVLLEIFNIQGEQIKTLINKYQPAGIYSVGWDGTDEKGIKVSSGVYIYRLQSGIHSLSKKMIYLR